MLTKKIRQTMRLKQTIRLYIYNDIHRTLTIHYSCMKLKILIRNRNMMFVARNKWPGLFP